MTGDLGKVERVLRAGLGLTAVGFGLFFQSWWGALGVLPLLTAINGFCPAYRLFGFDPRRKHSSQGG